MSKASVNHKIFYDKEASSLFFSGELTLHVYEELSQTLESVEPGKTVTLNFKEVAAIDTAGAQAILEFEARCNDFGVTSKRKDLNKTCQHIIELLEGLPTEKLPKGQVIPPLIAWLDLLGHRSVQFGQGIYELTKFIGLFFVNLLQSFQSFTNVLLPATFQHMRKAGLTAIPIVMTTSFVVGIVLSYEGIVQLSKFGAQMSVITLISFSVLREAGVLITAIVIAGRSGSAFAAEIGTMKVNEEVDAMRVMGLNPIHVLVVPRVMALIIFLPVLTLIADFCGLLGGAIICLFEINTDIFYFFRHVREIVNVETFMIGIVKAPIFGMMIALIGCMEGLKVQGNAESVGSQTTISVVKSIFCVIILDSIIAVLVSYLRIG